MWFWAFFFFFSLWWKLGIFWSRTLSVRWFFCPAKASLYLRVIICRRFSGVQTKTDCGQLKFVCDLQLSEIRLQCCTPKAKKLKVQGLVRGRPTCKPVSALYLDWARLSLILTYSLLVRVFLQVLWLFLHENVNVIHISPSNNSFFALWKTNISKS